MTDNPTYTSAVTNLQRYLRRISEEYDGANLFSVPIDGIYDTRTRDAVSEFQRLNGIEVTGDADKQTWDAIFIEYSRLVREIDGKTDPDFFPLSPENYETDFGEKSIFISALQLVLDELRVSYDSIPAFEMNGTFDGDTSLAVKEFQRIHGLPVTGRVDRNTWNRMSDAFNRYARYAR